MSGLRLGGYVIELESDTGPTGILSPIDGALIVTCKNCGKPLAWPKALPLHVLGALCSVRCSVENREHYDD